MSFYNYVIGRLYSWGARRENDTPIANVVFTMCIVHYFQFFTVYMILRKVFNFRDFILEVNKLYVGLLLIAFFVLYYFLFFNREKWERYAKQVEQESERKRKRGKFFVLLYLIGSIVLFFISLPFVFG
jgi:formate hydrogenlyase subunit 3/multisubunit Na+/H+ antiporter MnhD subunit